MINLLFRLYRTVIYRPGQSTKVILFLLALFAYSASGYMYFELDNSPDLKWLDAVWWSFVTMTTVGYGDFFPSSTYGRLLVGLPTMLLGVSILGYILSLIASAMIESRMKEARGMKRIDVKDHVVICRYTDLGRILNLVHEIHQDHLTSNSAIVLVDDFLDELPAELVKAGILFVKGDPSREATMLQANAPEARAVIIQATADPIHSDNDNLKIALTLHELAPEINSIVECVNPDNEPFFRRAKCNSVVCLGSLTGQMIVQELQDPGVGAVVSELTSNQHGKQFYIINLPSPSGCFADLQRKLGKTDVIVLGIRRGEQNMLLPDPGLPLVAGDEGVLIAARRPVV